MGQCVCKERRRQDSSTGGGDEAYGERASTVDQWAVTSSAQQRLAHIGFDVEQLILETLNVIKTLVNNEQEPPPSMLKLNMIADKEQGWLMIVQTMIDMVPLDNPLGPAVITLFLDESPLPTKETVGRLLFSLHLSEAAPKPRVWHRNTCIVLGCIAEKLAGPNSVATFKAETLGYLTDNLHAERDANVILFSLIALEKYAQTSENKATINDRLLSMKPHPLQVLVSWIDSDDFTKRQVGFCSQWALDNLFTKKGRPYSYETLDTSEINAMLNHEDVSEYLKIGPNGLEARCDVSSFESVRCTFQVTEGMWYYEATIITPGVMQIGWATKQSKFLNHEGYGIGDDDYSVSYDGCRQITWHNANSLPHKHPVWKPGDILGSLLNCQEKYVQFYLNGLPLETAHTAVFSQPASGFFAAASFMSFQQCEFNFGHKPFRFPPKDVQFQCFNEVASLSPEQRIILPRQRKLEMLWEVTVPEDSCHLCYSEPASVVLQPCNHNGFCATCALNLELCPLCRAKIEERRPQLITPAPVMPMHTSGGQVAL